MTEDETKLNHDWEQVQLLADQLKSTAAARDLAQALVLMDDLNDTMDEIELMAHED